MQWLGGLVAGLVVAFLAPAGASGAGTWSDPSVIATTVGVDPGSAEIHALPVDPDDLIPTNALSLGGSLLVYTQHSHLYVLELDLNGEPVARYDISGPGGAISDVDVDFSYIADVRNRDTSDEYVKYQLSAVELAWVSESPDGSTRVMSGSLSVDGKVGPVEQRSALAVPPAAVAQPSVAAGETRDGEVFDRGYVWQQRESAVWRVAVRVVDEEGEAAPIRYASELIGATSEPGIASTGGGGYRVAWLQQTPNGKNIITAGFNEAGELKLYKPVPGSSEPDPKNPPRPEFDFSRYEVLQPKANFGPGPVGEPSELNVWSSKNGVIRLTWTRVRTEGSKTQRVIEGAGYIEGANYWVDIRPTEQNPPGPPIDRTLQIVRLTPMSRTITDLSIRPSSRARFLISYRSVSNGDNWLMGGQLLPDGFPSIRARDINELATAGARPLVGLNRASAAVLAWADPSQGPGNTGMWATYAPSRGFPVPSMRLDSSGVSSIPLGAVVDPTGVPMVLSEPGPGGIPALARSYYTDPRVEVLTPKVRFGQTIIGSAPMASVYLINRGTGQSAVYGIDMDDNSGQFELVDPSACVGHLASDSICEVKVRFSPALEGPSVASLTVDSSEGQRDVEITGNGQVRKRLEVRLAKYRINARTGGKLVLKAKVRNSGGAPVSDARLCVSGWRKVVRPARRCVELGEVGSAASIDRRFVLRVRGKAPTGVRPLKVTLDGRDTLNRRKIAKVRVR